MLTLTKKEYEVEEPVQLKDEQDNIIYEFTMQITPDEMKELKDMIFDDKDVKNGRKLAKLDSDSYEYEELETKVLDNAKKRQERLEEICFKEHREEFKEKAGEYKYLEMVEIIYNFFFETFVEQRAKQVNTMTSSLKKISSN